MRKLATSIALSLLLFGSHLLAQDEFIPDPGQEAAAGKAPPGKTDEQKKEEDAIKKYDELLKDAVKTEGPFTFYIKKKDVFLELDPSQLGKYWVIQGMFRTGAAGMMLTSGFPVNRDFQAVDVFRWERREDDVWLYVPNLYWRWAAHDPQATAAARSFPEGVLDSYKIEVEHPKTKKIVLKVTQLFHGELFNLNESIMMGMQRPYQLDREKTRVTRIKGFPENVVVTVDMYYSAPRGGQSPLAALLAQLGLDSKSHLADDRSLPFQVTYLIYPRKESDYVPRHADPRVGYFAQEFFDHKLFKEDDRVVQLINRFNLKKQDPTAARSEPVKPIVWYIDPSIPREFRPAVREGILRWNKAFDRIGYQNAIQVQEIPEGEEWDHSDMRHNVVRMSNSENAGFAIALLRTDPFTGEILNASVNIDNNIVWFAFREFRSFADPAGKSFQSALAKLVKSDAEGAGIRLRPRGWTDHTCTIGEGKLCSAEFGLAAGRMLGSFSKISEKEYVDQFIADVISHEIGHCLGLRHNFVASTSLTASDLANDATTREQGNSASVMDYVPVNIAAVAKGSGNYYSSSVGAYDIFAIQYGYADVEGSTPESQLHSLKKIAANQSLHGNAYQSDEQADQFDPFITRFDLGSDPLETGAITIRVAKRMLSVADKWYPVQGRPFVELVRVVNLSMRQTFQEVMNATRFVGGIQTRRNFSGDPEEKPTAEPVSPAVQRRALQQVARELLSENSFNLSERILLNLSSDYKSGPFSEAPIKDVIAAMQRSALSEMLSADTVSRIANNAFKHQHRRDRLTIVELYSTLAGKVFSEVGTGRPIGVLRRELQRFMIEGLIVQMTASPGRVEEDARIVARDLLKRLGERFGSAKAKDDMTRIHIADVRERIDRALKAVVVGNR